MPIVTDERALLSGSYWTGIEVESKPVFVTYSFQSAATGSHAGVLGATAAATFQALNAAQENSVRAALAEWGDASGITFLEVLPGEGAITFSSYDFAGSPIAGVGGYCEYPFGNWDYATASSTPDDYLFYDDAPFERGGDVLLDKTAGVNVYGTILHEIGHALGFKHPTEVVYNHEEVLSSDDPNLTIMSTVGGGTGHLTALDKAAAARVYGAAASDGSQVASWSWNASTRTLTQTGFATADEIRGTNVSDVINGMGGDDKIFGLGGNDVLNGGQGNDRIFDAANHPDTTAIDGGAGDDRIALYLVSAGFTGTIDGGADSDRLVAYGDLSGLAISNVETFVGSYYGAATLTAAQLSGFTDLRHEQDEFSFAPSHALSLALAGGGAVDFSGKVAAAVNLTVQASAAGNTLTGHAGIDTLLGSTGIDVFRGGDGEDFLDGGGNDDVFLIASPGEHGATETIDGGTGNADRIRFTSTTAGQTLVLSNQVKNVEIVEISNASGNAAGTASLHVNASAVTQSLTLRGNGGSNTLVGTAFNDVLFGGKGSDTLDGGAGSDTADFSDKVDSVVATLKGSSTSNVVVKGSVQDKIRNIESLIGGSANDTLSGDDGVNTLIGGAGDDLLFGGKGKDVLDGGGDIDTASFTDKVDAVVVTLNGATNALVQIKGAVQDTIRNIENLIGGTAADTFVGDGLSNLFRGGLGADTLDGGNGRDTADYSDKTLAVSVVLNGAASAVVSVGNIAEDTIRRIEDVIGGTGNDALTGDSAANALFGGFGKDFLKGGKGNDVLDGGEGSDTADFSDKVDSVIVTLNGSIDAAVRIKGSLQDTVRNIENLNGGSAADTFVGDAADNIFNGAGGADSLTGNGGNDIFVFTKGQANGD